jgi:transcriptional regulator GlxA family with amidase domain
MKRNGSGYSQAGNQVLSRNDAQRSAQDAPPNHSPGVEKIAQSITYMMQHLDQPLQVATLAATVNVSPSHFFALFKRRIGSAPMDYFTRLRMQRACRSLERTSLSVKEIASELGYDDPFYFSRVFKSVNRMSPSDYRAAQREMASKTKEAGEVSNFPRAPKAAKVPGRLQFA